MDKTICAPGKYDKKNKTCLTTNQLVQMAKAYNRFSAKNMLNPNHIKNMNGGLIDIKNDKNFLLKQFKNIMDNVCNDSEICWTKQNFMNEVVKEMREDIGKNFRPNGPENPKEWLSTSDINDIMTQYQEIYPDFIFLGAVPLDCDNLSFCKLYNLNFAEYQKKKINQLGIIFNLDKYGQPGSHWVSLYINLKSGEICFCDSIGNEPIQNVNTIIKSFKKFYQNLTGSQATCHINTNPYQQDESECGIYSCNFLIRKLSGEDFDSIVNNPLTFKEINSCRNVYFNNKPSQYEPHIKCDPKIAY